MSTPSDAIIVCGMPRSGTTILTAVLATHPDVQLFCGGKEWMVLENDQLHIPDAEGTWKETIAKCCEIAGPKRPLFKRPWIEKWGCVFWHFFDGATVLATLKRPAAQLESWARHAPDKDKTEAHYNDHCVYLQTFRQRTGLDAHIVHHDLIASDIIWAGIASVAGLPSSGFDLSLFTTHWRDHDSQAFVDKHAIRIEDIT